MPTDEIIIRIFCIVDDRMRDVKKHPLARLYPSEVVTMRVYGITHILTINVADFTRYQSLGIVPVHPKDLFQTDVSV